MMLVHLWTFIKLVPGWDITKVVKTRRFEKRNAPMGPTSDCFSRRILFRGNTSLSPHGSGSPNLKDVDKWIDVKIM